MTTKTRPMSIPVADRFEAFGGLPFRPDADRPRGDWSVAADRHCVAAARRDTDGFGRPARPAAVPTPMSSPVPARSPEDEFEECERWDGMA